VPRVRIAIATAVVVGALVAPAALAADEPGPVPEPTAVPAPTATPVENGEIVIDPTFIIATPTPAGAVHAATGRPDVTPPATDTGSLAMTTTPGTSLQVLGVLGVVGTLLALAAGLIPAGRRR
jgi:hypothetical protein